MHANRTSSKLHQIPSDLFVRLSLGLMLVLAAGCDSPVVAPAAEGTRSQKLAEYRLAFDLEKGTVTASQGPLSEARPPLSPPRPLWASSIVDGYFRQDSIWCTGCNDDQLGWHQIQSALRNVRNGAVKLDSIQAACLGCVQLIIGAFPSVVANGGSYTQVFDADVAQQQFTIAFSLWGEPI